MDASIKAKWTAALRSGEYKQATGSLRVPLEDVGFGYCCIGVLGDIQGLDWDGGFSRCTSDLPDEALHGGLTRGCRLELEHMNDGTSAAGEKPKRKHSFSEIADFIDATH